MPTFQLTLSPYDPERIDTDHFVRWVKAPTQSYVEDWIEANGLEDDVIGLEPITNHDFNDGLDVHIFGRTCKEFAMVGSVAEWKQEIVDWHKEKGLMLILNKQHLIALKKALFGTNSEELLYVRECISAILLKLKP